MRIRPGLRPLIGLGICCCLLQGADTTPPPTPQKVQVSNTEHSDFPAGGTLHLKNSVGELTIESWDQPGLELTTVKSSKVAVAGKERDNAVKLLDRVKIATERKGDEVTISTEFPKYPKLVRPYNGFTDFDLDYVIKVPSSAHLTIEHTIGEVHIDGVLGGIHATDRMGLITVRLPDGQFAINAVSKIGAVDSDFPGSENSKKWIGHTFVGNASSSGTAQKIFLRIGFGDIVVTRMHHPSPPAPGVPSGK